MPHTKHSNIINWCAVLIFMLQIWLKTEVYKWNAKIALNMGKWMSIIADGFFLLSRSLDYSFIDLLWQIKDKINLLSKQIFIWNWRLAYIDPFRRTIILSVKCIGIEQCSFLYVLPQQQGAENHEEKRKHDLASQRAHPTQRQLQIQVSC